MKRPEWDIIWMALASMLGQRSTCQRLSVGCVVVSHDNTRVLSLGYNGNHRGGLNQCDSKDSPGACGCLHAEDNALLKMDYGNLLNKKAYVTHMPCVMCAKRFVNSSVSTVIFKEVYRDNAGILLLQRNGVMVRHYRDLK